MPSFLSLPREIRRQIIREVILTPRDAPLSPSACKDRVPLQNGFDALWARATNVFVEKEPVRMSHASLLGTCCQLRIDTEAVLGSFDSSRFPYSLDVMIVKHIGILPTWVSFPSFPKQIRTLRVQVRVFDPPANICREWSENAVFDGSSDRTERTSWNMMVLFTIFVLNPWHREYVNQARDLTSDSARPMSGDNSSVCDEPRGSSESTSSPSEDTAEFSYDTFAPYTIRRIIVNVSEVSPEQYDLTSEHNDDTQQVHTRQMVFSQATFQGAIWPPSQTLDEPFEPTPQLKPAYRVAHETWSAIALANTRFPFSLYGDTLFANIGAIEIRVGDIWWDEVDITRLICGPDALIPEPNRHDDQPRAADWKLRAVQRRLEHGLWNTGASGGH